MTDTDLTAMAEAVQTEADFLAFARALLENWKLDKSSAGGRGDGWENTTIEGFLSGMIRWSQDADRTRQYNAPPDWGLFAFMLLAGSRYE
jgi:hypothetical protein